MPEENSPPKRLLAAVNQRKRWKSHLLLATVAVCLCLLIGPPAGTSASDGAASDAAVPHAVSVVALRQKAVETIQYPKDVPAHNPAPTPTPTPTPYNYAEPLPPATPVGMDYFSDAVFIGDSRTDGLRLYSGIKGTTFFCYKGITVFDIMNKPNKRVVTVKEKKYTVLEALALRPYNKVYISLGVNELGYGNDKGFEACFSKFLTKVRELQPDAVIYLQNLAPVNPKKCKANAQPVWANNEQVAAYNKIYTRLAEEQQVLLLDVASSLVDETGILPAEGTVDGIHFTKDWYKAWLAYLMSHTTDPAIPGASPVKGAS